MPLAGVAPPATLSVVSGYNNKTMPVSLASVDWQSSGFLDTPGAQTPSSDVLQIATTAAQSMVPLSPGSPAVNTSFHIQFLGPTVQCSLASDSQQIVFDNYSRALANNTHMIATKGLFESGHLKWGKGGIPLAYEPLMNVYSAFSPSPPWAAYDGLDDAYNNWVPGFDFMQSFKEFFPIKGREDERNFVKQHLLIQTADQAIVCTLGNATFDVGYEFVETASPLVQYSILKFDPIWLPDSEHTTLLGSYLAVYPAFSNMVQGNVSTTLMSNFNASCPRGTQPSLANYTYDSNVTIFNSSSRALQHGLSACDDFKLGYVSRLLCNFQ